MAAKRKSQNSFNKLVLVVILVIAAIGGVLFLSQNRSTSTNTKAVEPASQSSCADNGKKCSSKNPYCISVNWGEKYACSTFSGFVALYDGRHDIKMGRAEDDPSVVRFSIGKQPFDYRDKSTDLEPGVAYQLSAGTNMHKVKGTVRVKCDETRGGKDTWDYVDQLRDEDDYSQTQSPTCRYDKPGDYNMYIVFQGQDTLTKQNFQRKLRGTVHVSDKHVCNNAYNSCSKNQYCHNYHSEDYQEVGSRCEPSVQTRLSLSSAGTNDSQYLELESNGKNDFDNMTLHVDTPYSLFAFTELYDKSETIKVKCDKNRIMYDYIYTNKSGYVQEIGSTDMFGGGTCLYKQPGTYTLQAEFEGTDNITKVTYNQTLTTQVKVE